MNNKQLRALFPLSQKVRLYVPSTVNIDEATDNTEHVEQTLKMFGELFGGATSYEALGAWNGSNGKLVQERVTIIESYANRLEPTNIIQVIDYAKQLCKNMSQDAIAVEVNGSMGFIS